jgi:hypothetical protein
MKAFNIKASSHKSQPASTPTSNVAEPKYIAPVSESTNLPESSVELDAFMNSTISEMESDRKRFQENGSLNPFSDFVIPATPAEPSVVSVDPEVGYKPKSRRRIT